MPPPFEGVEMCRNVRGGGEDHYFFGAISGFLGFSQAQGQGQAKAKGKGNAQAGPRAREGQGQALAKAKAGAFHRHRSCHCRSCMVNPQWQCLFPR